MPAKKQTVNKTAAEVTAAEEIVKNETPAEDTAKSTPKKTAVKRTRKTAAKKAAETAETAEAKVNAEAPVVEEVKPVRKRRTTKKAAETAETAEVKANEEAPAAEEVKPVRKRRTTKKAAAKTEDTAVKAEGVAAESEEAAGVTESTEAETTKTPAKKTAAKKTAAKKTTTRKTAAKKAAAVKETAADLAAEVVKTAAPAAKEAKDAAAEAVKTAAKTAAKTAKDVKEAATEAVKTAAPAVKEAVASVKTAVPAVKKAKSEAAEGTTVKAAETEAAGESALEEVLESNPVETVAENVNAWAAVETEVEVKAEAEEEAEVKAEEAEEAEVKAEAGEETAAEEAEVKAEAVEETAAEEVKAEAVPVTPRRSIAFIGSECHPFVKTGGLGDVMYALPRALTAMNCDVRVLLPRYSCIPQKYQDKMVYRGAFYMDLGETGRNYYVGIMEYICDGVVYDFIDNQEFFTGAKPYTNLVDDIPKYCYFSKAALAALNYMNWIPDVIHCHDWQAGLVPVMLREFFQDTPLAHSKTVLTIHNLRFQGIYNIKTIKHWTGLPDYVFNKDHLKQGFEDANMFKGGLAYADRITTVSGTYAKEIQTEEYGESLDAHLRYHAGKLSGIVNGIDYEMWNPWTDPAIAVNYDITNVLERKKENKRALQEELGLAQDEGKFVIGLISRLTDQKGLDLVNAIIPSVMDGNTQVVVLGTGDPQYENSFRGYEYAYKGSFAACIQYDEARAHRIYAGADALLVPSRFEPCGLTQLNAMHYGTVPIVRETGGLKDTVMPYDQNVNGGNGFTFDRYDADLLLDAVNRAKTFFFTNRWCWDEMVQRDMDKDVSWENSAKQYKNLYLTLTQW